MSVFVIIFVLFLNMLLYMSLIPDGFIDGSPNESSSTLIKNNNAFPECSNCIRYYDTVICKCRDTNKDSIPQTAFIYPTNITPDIDLSKISSETNN